MNIIMIYCIKDTYSFGVIKFGLLAGYIPMSLSTFAALHYSGENQV